MEPARDAGGHHRARDRLRRHQPEFLERDESLERLAPEHGCEVVRIFRSVENGNGGALTRESLARADVAIEFTAPIATPQNIRRLVEFGVPVVTGTTGWFEEISQIREITAAKNGSVVWGPNFSVGLHHFRAVVTEAARRLAHEEAYGAWGWEIHHAAKKETVGKHRPNRVG